jgi:hypothetical protein
VRAGRVYTQAKTGDGSVDKYSPPVSTSVCNLSGHIFLKNLSNHV